MKNILCYGDSNTWGYNPARQGERFQFEKRWTTILQDMLGSNFNIIPEGLNSRTTVWDDPIREGVNGKKHLMTTLLSHKPLDLVVLFLGTNDLKKRYNLPASDIALGVGVLVDIIKKSEAGINGLSPEIVVVIPPEIRQLSNFKDQFGDCIETSKLFPLYFKQMVDDKNIDYLEIGKDVRFSDIDGIHFEETQLNKVASIISNYVRGKL